MVRRVQRVVMRRRYRRRQWKKFLRLAAVYAAWFAVAGFTMAVFWAGGRFWTASQFFRIKKVNFIGELGGLYSDLRRGVTIKEGEHLFGFSSKQTVKELKSKFPELNGVEIKRRWNGVVEIAAGLRVPLARIVYGGESFERVSGKLVFVDKDGVRFKLNEDGAALAGQLPFMENGMPPASEKSVLGFLDVYAASELRQQIPVDRIWADGFGNVFFTLIKGPKIMWGQAERADFGIKMERLYYVVNHFGVQELLSSYIRFINPERIVVGDKGVVR